MHGVKRTRQSQDERDAQKRRELVKIDEFNKLAQAVLTRKKENDWSQAALALTTKLLQINPEFYTIWNYRRTILTNGIFADSHPEATRDVLMEELVMTMTALKAHPKVYWIWNHRRWCLENIPDGPGQGAENQGWKQAAWNKELFVVEKMLDADPRNFHAWDYRRYILSEMPTPPSEASELVYTSKKIESNFSNYSAWHQRSKILASLWAQGKLDESKSREQELGLLRNAMYTDPNDQSVWMYHRWLVGSDGGKSVLVREIAAIQELLDEQPDSKWCLESIVHYKRLLLRSWSHDPDIDAQQLSNECIDLLQRLEALDPMRSNRYRELAGVESW